MPQLEKRGKWIFGWVIVISENTIRIPPEAYKEYGFQTGERVTISRGSKSSGGFGVAHEELFNNSVLGNLRRLDSSTIEKDGILTLPPTLALHPGDRLLACRGSYLALSFLTHGLIFETAQKHPEVETFTR